MMLTSFRINNQVIRTRFTYHLKQLAAIRGMEVDKAIRPWDIEGYNAWKLLHNAKKMIARNRGVASMEHEMYTSISSSHTKERGLASTD